MKLDTESITHLNRQLTNELTAINQYYLHAKMYENWGLHALFRHEYKESIEEMQHANEIIERILLLEGLPNVQELHKMMIGENVPECLTSDLNLERGAREDIVNGIAYFEEAKDYASREMFDKLLVETEDHIDYLETQLELIEKVGLQNYLQSQMGPQPNAN